MKLPIPLTYRPMEARVAAVLPTGQQWQYEPKWDGFRCLAFRDGSRVDLRSRNGYAFAHHFPEITRALARSRTSKLVLDGEIVIPVDGELSFDALLDRLHPPEGGARALQHARHRACFIVFDLLADDGGDVTALPLTERRERLASLFVEDLAALSAVQLSPCTTDRDIAQRWLQSDIGAEGVVAKRRDCAYASGERSAMVKVKHMKTAECVVAGFRLSTKGDAIGSLLLGLFDDNGLLHHCGHTASFTKSERSSVARRIEPLIGGAGFSGRLPGPNPWSHRPSDEWVPLDPRLVCEVRYDHFSDHRFRHGTKLLRWRPDKEPRECNFAQVTPRRERQSAKNRSADGNRANGVTAA